MSTWSLPFSKSKGPVDLGPASIILGLAIYTGLYFAVGDAWALGREWFALAVLWIAALAIAEIAAWVHFPRAPAMVLSGLCWAQIPNSATLHLPRDWVGLIRALALSVALLMGGFELEFETIWRLKVPSTLYMLLPMIAVVAVVATVSSTLVGMPILLGLAFGFILNPTSPSIIVAQMLSLEGKGLGIKNDVGVIAMMAAILDEVANLTGYVIVANMALPNENSSPMAWTVLKGPTEVVVGVAAGALLGLVCGCSRIWDTTAKRCMAVFVSVLTLMSIMHAAPVEMMTGGAIAALMVGLIAPLMWERGLPKLLSLGPNEHFADTLEHVTSLLWSWVFEPLLFGTIAYDVVFSEIDGSMVLLSLAFVFLGQAVRFIATIFTMKVLRASSWKESTFYAVSVLPKGTVQAALGALPLAAAHHLAASNPNKELYLYWGHLIKGAGALSVAIWATLGTLSIEKLAPFLLEKEKPVVQQMEEELEKIQDEQEGYKIFSEPDSTATPFTNASTAAAVAAGTEHLQCVKEETGTPRPDSPVLMQKLQSPPSQVIFGIMRKRTSSGTGGCAGAVGVDVAANFGPLEALRAFERMSRSQQLRSSLRNGSITQLLSSTTQQQQRERRRQSSTAGSTDGAVLVPHIQSHNQNVSGAAGVQLRDPEHPTPTDDLTHMLLQQPEVLFQYLTSVHELLGLLVTQPAVLHGLPDAARLAGQVAHFEQLLYTHRPLNARQLMKASNGLNAIGQLRSQAAGAANDQVLPDLLHHRSTSLPNLPQMQLQSSRV